MDYLARALELAERALGRVSPNPAVGAVVVKHGLIVGEGYTRPPGGKHAEIVALEAAGPRADGADLYVTLEPCCHFGRTPPCTDAIKAAGIRSVHLAVLDPYPAVNGRGVAILRQAGIDVQIGGHSEEAHRLNAAFFHFVRTGRPYVTAKWAMSLDGKIATWQGDSRWVTGDAARQLVHQERDRSDAIVVGVGTVLADDPLLTVRLGSVDQEWVPRPQPPLRVVVDSQLRTPSSAKVLASLADGAVLIATTSKAPAARIEERRRQGAEVVVLPEQDGRVDLKALLDELARRGAIRVLLEAGGELTGAFLRQRLVDRVLAFVAPKIVGGRAAPGPVGGDGVAEMARALPLRDLTVQSAGGDLLLEGRLVWDDDVSEQDGTLRSLIRAARPDPG